VQGWRRTGHVGCSAGSGGHVCSSTFLELGETMLGKAMQAAMQGLHSLIPVLVLGSRSPGAPRTALSRNRGPFCVPAVPSWPSGHLKLGCKLTWANTMVGTLQSEGTFQLQLSSKEDYQLPV